MEMTQKLIEEKLISVVRAKNKEIAIQLAKFIVAGGIKSIEITFTIPEAEEVILQLSNELDQDVLLGAGTVLNIDMCKKAIKNGAKYIVSPGFDEQSADYCYTQNIPYLPGCMTVTEIMKAMKHHVKVIKLFPGNHFDFNFIKSIKGPLPDIKVMVTGGVDIDNIQDWLKNGADCVGIGSALTKYYVKDDNETVSNVARKFKNKIKGV
ncbi:MAG: bifunctional 2-keto-4-hydroxyglutarate aldolase/2-keto-3-deoxy-6-phosphogluconate aldolase [Candidatus Izimaplasma sp.]|nr:bifunctional 2-keto-4-hydroxyglutarate aldolase/2-keto-3-deoxy-6-phosphogluconate aldolase [Candidatus Izimaplasma bacterium]